MKTPLAIDIIETEEALANLLRTARDASERERLQFLHRQKTGLASDRSHLARSLRKTLPTVRNWIERCQERGLNGPLERDYKGGAHFRKISKDAVADLDERPKEETGFSSFEEIRPWPKARHGAEVACSTVRGLARYRLKASPKVPRPCSERQDPEAAEEFEKNCTNR